MTPFSLSQIMETMAKFTETLSAKQKEADEFGAKHRITATGGAGAPKKVADDDEGGSAGVLI